MPFSDKNSPNLLLTGWGLPAAVARFVRPRLLPRRRCSSEQHRQAGGDWSSSACSQICRSGGWWCSWFGPRSEGVDRPVELLSLDLFFVMVRLLLASPWGCWGCCQAAGGCCCRWILVPVQKVWRGLEAAAVGVRGFQADDLATSGEVEWRWPQVWGGKSLGELPGRWSIFSFRSSSSELVGAAARQRLWARSSSVPVVCGASGWFRRRHRWWWPGMLGAREVEDEVLQLCCSLYPLCCFGACICSCNVFLSV